MNYSFLSNTKLFRGMDEASIAAMLACLGAKKAAYEKNQIICRTGETVTNIGMVLSGSVNIEHTDYWGNKTVISHVSPGLIFGETYMGLPEQPSLTDIVATEETETLNMDIVKVIKTCPNACPHHTALIRNLLIVFSHKNLQMAQRALHTSFKTLRARLLSYFFAQQKESGSNTFTIPFNRQQLADYLNADRSAICNEISKMKRDGIIKADKNTFTLLQTPIL